MVGLFRILDPIGWVVFRLRVAACGVAVWRRRCARRREQSSDQATGSNVVRGLRTAYEHMSRSLAFGHRPRRRRWEVGALEPEENGGLWGKSQIIYHWSVWFFESLSGQSHHTTTISSYIKQLSSHPFVDDP